MNYADLVWTIKTQGEYMYHKTELKTFTLTMLGTNTIYTPALKNKKTAPLKVGTKLQEHYPKGETLSIVSTLINTKEKPILDPQQFSPYQATEVVVINGPKTNGANVGEKIGIGLGTALNAVARNQTMINIIAHSRGAVQSILIAHEMNTIQEIINSCDTVEQLIKELTTKQMERSKNKTLANTPDIIKSLLTQLPKTKEEQSAWLTALKKNIPETNINFFAIDPVPGDCWPVTWVDPRFLKLPAIIKHAEFIYYENERSAWGFTPIFPEPANEEQQVIRNTLPGHHGTGSAGNNTSQQNIVVSPEHTKTTHVQKLIIYKLMEFLVEHGVQFKDGREVFREYTGLGRKYAQMLDEMGGNQTIVIEKLDFPTIYRTLYDKIYSNKEGYEAFNNTNYPMMGLAPRRKILKTDHNYVLFTEVFPNIIGFVNEEHSKLMKEIFLKILDTLEEQHQNLIEEFKAFQENCGLFAEIEKLHHQLDGFLSEITALIKLFTNEEAVLKEYELSLKPKIEMLIEVAAQKFYASIIAEEPSAPTESSNFRTLVINYALQKSNKPPEIPADSDVLEDKTPALYANEENLAIKSLAFWQSEEKTNNRSNIADEQQLCSPITEPNPISSISPQN